MLESLLTSIVIVSDGRAMAPSPDFIRLLVRGLAWDASQGGRRLVDAIEIASRGRLVRTPRGSAIAGTDAAGVAVEFLLPPCAGLRVADIRALCADLRAKSEAFADVHEDTIVVRLLSAYPARRAVKKAA